MKIFNYSLAILCLFKFFILVNSIKLNNINYLESSESDEDLGSNILESKEIPLLQYDQVQNEIEVHKKEEDPGATSFTDHFTEAETTNLSSKPADVKQENENDILASGGKTNYIITAGTVGIVIIVIVLLLLAKKTNIFKKKSNESLITRREKGKIYNDVPINENI
jgi:hypothetical protein